MMTHFSADCKLNNICYYTIRNLNCLVSESKNLKLPAPVGGREN